MTYICNFSEILLKICIYESYVIHIGQHFHLSLFVQLNKSLVTVRDKCPQINVQFKWHTFSKRSFRTVGQMNGQMDKRMNERKNRRTDGPILLCPKFYELLGISPGSKLCTTFFNIAKFGEKTMTFQLTGTTPELEINSI